MEVAGADPETWAVSFLDECWWSRVALPTLNAWGVDGEPIRLIQRSVAKDDPEPKAISCYGLYLPRMDRTWIRFVDGRPVCFHNDAVSFVVLRGAPSGGKEDGAAHLGQRELACLQRGEEMARKTQPPRQRERRGVRIVSCLLPKQSPWLNAIEPKWVHAKRKVVEPEGLLGAYELADRVCGVFDCPHHEHLTVRTGRRLIMH